jgi:hypothetical protein
MFWAMSNGSTPRSRAVAGHQLHHADRALAGPGRMVKAALAPSHGFNEPGVEGVAGGGQGNFALDLARRLRRDRGGRRRQGLDSQARKHGRPFEARDLTFVANL